MERLLGASDAPYTPGHSARTPLLGSVGLVLEGEVRVC